MTKKLKAVFFGTPDFSIPSLDMLNAHPLIDLQLVVTMPDRPAGRGLELKAPPVAMFAKEHSLELFQTNNVNKESQLIERLNELQPDFIVVLAFAQFLGSKILNLPKLGCYNIHTSLLPKYRGAAPIQYALLNGDSSTGVSIQKMVKKMDAGNIVLSHPISIAKNETCELLYTRLKFQAALCLVQFIEDLLLNKVVESVQDETKVSFAPEIKKEDGHLDFNVLTAQEIDQKIRAFTPWPGTFFYLNKKRVKVIEAELSNQKIQPSHLKTIDNALYVGTKNASIKILKLAMEGKKACSSKDFINGFKGNLEDFVINSDK